MVDLFCIDCTLPSHLNILNFKLQLHSSTKYLNFFSIYTPMCKFESSKVDHALKGPKKHTYHELFSVPHLDQSLHSDWMNA